MKLSNCGSVFSTKLRSKDNFWPAPRSVDSHLCFAARRTLTLIMGFWDKTACFRSAAAYWAASRLSLWTDFAEKRRHRCAPCSPSAFRAWSRASRADHLKPRLREQHVSCQRRMHAIGRPRFRRRPALGFVKDTLQRYEYRTEFTSVLFYYLSALGELGDHMSLTTPHGKTKGSQSTSLRPGK